MYLGLANKTRWLRPIPFIAPLSTDLAIASYMLGSVWIILILESADNNRDLITTAAAAGF